MYKQKIIGFYHTDNKNNSLHLKMYHRAGMQKKKSNEKKNDCALHAKQMINNL